MLRDRKAVVAWACQVDVRSFGVLDAMSIHVAIKIILKLIHRSHSAKSFALVIVRLVWRMTTRSALAH